MIKKSEFEIWYQTAKPGDTIIYHMGANVQEVTKAEGKDGAIKTHEFPYECARLVRSLSEKGTIFPSQRRYNDREYEFRATRISAKTWHKLNFIGEKDPLVLKHTVLGE